MASQFNGPLTGYRIADARFPIFDGGGAAQYGGRWNSSGRRVIYGSVAFAGALLEQLARAQIGITPREQQWVSFHIGPHVIIEAVKADDLPKWDASDYVASRAYGDVWYDQRRSVALVVPSVVGRPVERNILINQSHPDFARIAVSDPLPLEWDDRLHPSPRRSLT
jgi:RES domain-containing protein